MAKAKKPRKHGSNAKPHKKLRRKCKHCEEKGHGYIAGIGDTHRFHGVGSFCRTHFSLKNPAVVKTCHRKGKKKKS